MKSKTKRNLERVLIEIANNAVKEKQFKNRAEAIMAIESTTRKLF